MSEKCSNGNEFKKILDIIVRLLFVSVLVVYSYQILQPFLMICIWGAILAISTAPFCDLVSTRIGGRRTMAAVLTSLTLLVAILLPSFYLADSLVGGVNLVRDSWEQGKLRIPAPTEQIKELPLIGSKVFEYWSLAYNNIEKLLEPLAPYLKEAGGWILSAAANIGIVVGQFILSIIVACLFLANWERCGQAMRLLSSRLNAARGKELLHDAALTIRSVTRGILGVSFIQAVLTGVGLAFAGIPGAGLWALLALILGIIQIGVTPILIMAVVYLFSTASTLKASLFLAWALIVGPMDNILKPIMLGRGAPVPMLVIFLGSLGGFIRSGLFGLFVGAVILSLAYKLLISWIEDQNQPVVESAS